MSSKGLNVLEAIFLPEMHLCTRLHSLLISCEYSSFFESNNLRKCQCDPQELCLSTQEMSVGKEVSRDP